MRYFFSFTALLLFLSTSVFASSDPVYLTVDSDTLDKHQEMFKQRLKVLDVQEGIALIEFDESALPWLSLSMHRDFKRCGGFVFHEDLSQAQKTFGAQSERQWAKEVSLQNYSVNQAQLVSQLMERVEAQNISEMIEKMSEYHNRYYTSDTGVASSKWIASEWEKLIAGRNDATVELYQHDKWPQPTPILTIEGESSEVIIIGGHADSIAGFWGGSRSRAPGADDNASGISTITEVIRVIAQTGFKPQKTIQFMAYAAEEVGLRGSAEIAKDYARQGKQVAGVLQLDMTNYAGSDWDIVFMNDYTNSEQNAFLGKLIDQYLPELSWGYDRCGYACSDHASWHNEGYPASMPFETKSREKNPYIHSSRDTLERMGGNAEHAKKFAKLALAFVAELGD